MKSSLPLFLLIGVVLVGSLVGFIAFNLRSRGGEEAQEEELVAEVPAPYITLTPSSTGQVLSLSASAINGKAFGFEYELVYNTDKGVLQGVPGTVTLDGKTSVTRDLTLGTCSSGVCRYDKGVKDVKLTIRLRNKAGKLISKFVTEVAFLSKARELKSTDGKFSLNLDKLGKDYYTVLQTGAVPGTSPGEVTAGPYGVFSSGSVAQSGKITLGVGALHAYDGSKWTKLTGGKTSTLGTFVAVKE
ncbi:hypothetical protein HYZ78_00780 [Candidatus Microgenomates bacterium]|nr:hypothetical protein [Candidatus Microgenomates bacterium]